MYTLIYQTITGNVETEFGTFTEALDYALNYVSPEVSGQTMPNVPEELFADRDYVSGVFWFKNRFAVIVNDK